MPPAELIFEDKQVLADGAIIEMRIWRVPAAVPLSPHEFKYTLFYGRPGEVVVLLTMSAARATTGIGKVEATYLVESPERLIEDFTAAVRAARKEE